MRPAFAPLALALTLSLSAAAAPVPTELDAKLEGLMQELERARLEHHVPGLAVAVVVDDRVVLARGLGLADVIQGRPVDPRTLFAIGSTTKAFTATLAAMEVEKQRIQWDEPISWYLPEMQLKPESDDPKAAVTFRDAFSHRSGFARMGVLWAAGSATPEQVYKTASRAEPVAPFREEFHYNNVVYTAAGDAVGRAAGRRWDVLMQRRLLRPLGMRTATLSVEKAQRDDNLAVGYAWDEETEKYRELPMRDIHLVAPAGAINATVLDVSRWVRFQLARGVIDGKRLISADALEATWKPQIGIAEGSAYGLGWMVHERNGRRVVEHGGNIDGFAAQVTLYPDDGVGYVLLMNTTASILQQLSVSIVASHLLDDDRDESAPAGGLDLAPFVGDYIANFGPFKDKIFAVSVSNEKLHVDVPGQMNFELKPPDEDGKWVFAMTDQIALSFDRNAAGQVTGLKMYQGGLTFELPRSGFEPEVPSGEVPAEWAALFGKYRSPSLKQDITVLTQNGRLALDVPGQMVFELDPAAEGRWAFRVSSSLEVAFERDDEGRAVAMTQYRGGTAVETMKRTGDAPASAKTGSMEIVRALVKADERGRLIESLGGMRMRGSVRTHSSGLSGSVELTCEGLDRFRHELDQSPFLTALTIVDGERIHQVSNAKADDHLSAKQRRSIRLGHPLSYFTDWDLFFDGASYGGASQVGDRPTHVVKLKAEGLEPHELQIDAETGEVLMASSVEDSGGGLPQVPIKTVFSDYRDVGGLRLPHVITVSNAPTGSTTATFDSIETGLELPVGIFSTR